MREVEIALVIVSPPPEKGSPGLILTDGGRVPAYGVGDAYPFDEWVSRAFKTLTGLTRRVDGFHGDAELKQHPARERGKVLVIPYSAVVPASAVKTCADWVPFDTLAAAPPDEATLSLLTSVLPRV